MSNNSDVNEAMRPVREQHGNRIGLVTRGTGRTSQQLKKHADFARHFRTNGLLAALATAGRDSWRQHPETFGMVRRLPD